MTDISPTLDLFLDNFQKENAQVVWMRYTDTIETPASASLKLMSTHRYFSLLESADDGSHRGRYTFIGVSPDLIWKCDTTHAYTSYDQGTTFEQCDAEILKSFRDLHAESQLDLPDELPPMSAGLIGYMAYDAIRFTETTVPDQNPDEIGIPVSVFMRPTITIVFDTELNDIFLVTPVWNVTGNGSECYNLAVDKLQEIAGVLKHTEELALETGADTKLNFKSNFTKESFCKMVEKAKDYILAGDIFQVVPSQRFESEFFGHPFAFYQALRAINPSPFLFYLNFDTFHLIGASPEIMVRVEDGTVTIRPLAGTRPRGKTPDEDKLLKDDLLADEKELAEHLMLVDLSRNDVGRVTLPGSVTVTELNVIEYYSHVMHITSNVEGKIAPNHDVLDALFSALPVGTVSGAPKVRAMQIIDELEPVKRSFYAGCVGYFSAGGDMDTCITLRTALIKDKKIYLQAGAGIVAASDPETEYDETLNKVQALIKAAENV